MGDRGERGPWTGGWVPLICWAASARACGLCPVLSVRGDPCHPDMVAVSGFLLLTLCLLDSLVCMSFCPTLYMLPQGTANIHRALPAHLTSCRVRVSGNSSSAPRTSLLFLRPKRMLPGSRNSSWKAGVQLDFSVAVTFQSHIRALRVSILPPTELSVLHPSLSPVPPLLEATIFSPRLVCPLCAVLPASSLPHTSPSSRVSESPLQEAHLSSWSPAGLSSKGLALPLQSPPAHCPTRSPPSCPHWLLGV